MSFFYFDTHLAILADNPQGRPPTCLGQVPENFQLCVSELESWASSYPDILVEVKRWELQGRLLMTKLRGMQLSHGSFENCAKNGNM